ncbi:unnamed protein product [Fraxinus pennsylvanica]|uniref:Pectinesterase inhibitor domain-containing protein n=1 Tax=Fraxinus pennsylvanica TaxID=56036 RepID=A0AAD2A253_9LAMI|nr:unnamed protein product [Fraxinus pennsylvanica]
MEECPQKYSFASDALQSSIQDLCAEIAAADYPNTCKNAFKRYSGLVYPPEIAVREEVRSIHNFTATANTIKEAALREEYLQGNHNFLWQMEIAASTKSARVHRPSMALVH